MALTNDEIKTIAKLARLEMDDADLEKFTTQLSGILEDAKKLDEVDTEGVKPIAQITGLENRVMKDSVNDCEFADELLGQSPSGTEDRMIKVKKVFNS